MPEEKKEGLTVKAVKKDVDGLRIEMENTAQIVSDLQHRVASITQTGLMTGSDVKETISTATKAVSAATTAIRAELVEENKIITDRLLASEEANKRLEEKISSMSKKYTELTGKVDSSTAEMRRHVYDINRNATKVKDDLAVERKVSTLIGVVAGAAVGLVLIMLGIHFYAF